MDSDRPQKTIVGMEEEKKVYPLTFTTLEDKYAWGKEEFKLADLGYRDSYIREGWLAGNLLSEVMDMYMDSIVGENVFGLYGRQFPFQIKNITVSGKMPLRVHPGDTVAEQRYDALGKEKLWIITNAGKDARLALGFREDTTAGKLVEGCTEGDIEGILNIRPVREGEYFLIPSGTPHAALGELSILEISESSALDFCLSGWGEEVSSEEFDPEMSLEEALDFINYSSWQEPETGAGTGELVSIPQFSVRTIALDDPIHIHEGDFDSCVAYFCVNGKASVRTAGEESGDLCITLDKNRVILVPADVTDFTVTPVEAGTELIEVYVKTVS